MIHLLGDIAISLADKQRTKGRYYLLYDGWGEIYIFQFASAIIEHNSACTYISKLKVRYLHHFIFSSFVILNPSMCVEIT